MDEVLSHDENINDFYSCGIIMIIGVTFYGHVINIYCRASFNPVFTTRSQRRIVGE